MPGNRLGDVSHAVQTRVEAEGLSIVRSLVGHGIGRDMHEDPQIPNFGEPGRGPLLEEGMVLAVEPMVTAGRHQVRMGDDGWAIYSQDGSLAAHFEFTVADHRRRAARSSRPGTRRPLTSGSQTWPVAERAATCGWSRLARRRACAAPPARLRRLRKEP